jgi:hypothetical protein
MFTLDPATLFIMIFFSMVGIGYYSYGKKESIYYRLAGIALLVYPYFSDNVWVLGSLGVLFMILPMLLDHFFPL